MLVPGATRTPRKCGRVFLAHVPNPNRPIRNFHVAGEEFRRDGCGERGRTEAMTEEQMSATAATANSGHSGATKRTTPGSSVLSITPSATGSATICKR